jgi:hypothetical protein
VNTVYGALGALVLILVAAVESLVSELLEARLGSPSLFGAALCGTVVGTVVILLRGRLSRWAKRRMPMAEKAAGIGRNIK